MSFTQIFRLLVQSLKVDWKPEFHLFTSLSLYHQRVPALNLPLYNKTLLQHCQLPVLCLSSSTLRPSDASNICFFHSRIHYFLLLLFHCHLLSHDFQFFCKSSSLQPLTRLFIPNCTVVHWCFCIEIWDKKHMTKKESGSIVIIYFILVFWKKKNQ